MLFKVSSSNPTRYKTDLFDLSIHCRRTIRLVLSHIFTQCAGGNHGNGRQITRKQRAQRERLSQRKPAKIPRSATHLAQQSNREALCPLIRDAKGSANADDNKTKICLCSFRVCPLLFSFRNNSGAVFRSFRLRRASCCGAEQTNGQTAEQRDGPLRAKQGESIKKVSGRADSTLLSSFLPLSLVPYLSLPPVRSFLLLLLLCVLKIGTESFPTTRFLSQRLFFVASSESGAIFAFRAGHLHLSTLSGFLSPLAFPPIFPAPTYNIPNGLTNRSGEEIK